MRSHILGIIVLALVIMLSTAVVHAQAARPVAVDILSVSSAEALWIVFEGRTEALRLAHIEVAWCMTSEARRRLDGLARNRVGLLQLSQASPDSGDGMLGYLWVDGSLLNELLVAEGYAVPASTAANSRYATEFQRAARLARRQGLGLWDACPSAGG